MIVSVADYLFQRLRQCGIQSIFGVPGDYNLKLLDYLEPNSLNWIGNCNELNAGYAADAYARILGIGAVVTTYGVGELSAINAIAGAFAEKAAVVHIVGSPARDLQEKKTFLHHTLGDGDYTHFKRMYEHITVAQVDLQDARTSASLIDMALQQCLMHRRPVYILVPEDLVDVQIPGEQLSMSISVPETAISHREEDLIQQILVRLESCQRPAILVDGESGMLGLTSQLNELARRTGWPTFTTPFGKGIINESLRNFHGLWMRDVGPEDHLEYARSCDLVLCFGPHWSDTNTYGFSSTPNLGVSLCFGTSYLLLDGIKHRNVSVRRMLDKLLQELNASTGLQKKNLPTLSKVASRHPNRLDQAITQANFYTEISSLFRPGDVILAETGTAGHGSRDFRLPADCVLLNPVTWLSIGYMLPAALGASLARRDSTSKGQPAIGRAPPRTILFMGDGSFQMSAQELSTILRHKINFILVLINNDGYTIERCIHGRNQVYNDVAAWNYLLAPAFFGANCTTTADYGTRTATMRTWADLNCFVNDETKCRQPSFSMVEAIMLREDAPQSLLNLLANQPRVE